MSSSGANEPIRCPKDSSRRTPKKRPIRPSRAETVTWPNPQRSVSPAVRRADQFRARARMAKGTQWSGAAVWRLPIVTAVRASVEKSASFTAAPSARARASWLSLSGESGRSLLEEAVESFGEIAAVGDAGKRLDLTVEMEVEAIHSGRLVDQSFRDPARRGGPGGDPGRDLEHVLVEAFDRQNGVEEPPLERRLRIEARVEHHQLHRPSQAEQARQEERRALGSGQTRLAIGPLEGGPIRGVDEVARHRNAEPSRRRGAVHGCQEGLGRALDLGDGRVDVLQDLLEGLAEPTRRRAARLEVAEILAVASGPDVLQVGAAAEDAPLAAKDDGPHLWIAGELQAGLAEVPRRGDVERVEAFAAVDRHDADCAFPLDADVGPLRRRSLRGLPRLFHLS